MTNLTEIIALSAPFIAIFIFAGSVIWTVYSLDKDNKKHPHKTKKV